jgi:hypothetical protein
MNMSDANKIESWFPSFKGRESIRVDEIAAKMSYSARHFQNLIAQGELACLNPAEKKSQWRVSATALCQFMARRSSSSSTTQKRKPEMKKNKVPSSKSLHDPRPHLFGDNITTVFLGEYHGDGFSAGSGNFDEGELLRNLSREQRADYRQAKREGFHPVHVIDLETAVRGIEMRKAE